MPALADAELSASTWQLQQPLRRCAAGALPPNVALMQLFGAAADPEQARAALSEAVRDASASEADRLRTMLDLWNRNPHSFAAVKTMLSEMDHTPASQGDGAVQYWASAFDRAASVSAATGVALYSLGNEELLAQATAEIVAWMEARALLTRESVVLDLGCGAGRMLSPVAERVRTVVGIDVSERMLQVAQRTLASRRNAHAMRTSGKDLQAFRNGSFDLVYAVDSFPYLVHAGEDLAKLHFREARRVLRPNGSFVLFNFAYDRDANASRRSVSALASDVGFAVVIDGERPFQLWDGLAFHLLRSAEAD
jgi:SAM-dependent methyltransferase